MGKIQKFAKGYNTIEKWSLCSLVAVMVIVSFTQVFTRYVLGNSLFWAEELGKFIFVWISWLGVSAGLKDKEHIQVKLLPDTLHAKGFIKSEKAIYILIDLLWFITSLTILLYGANIVAGQMVSGVYGSATGIPMWLAYLCVPLSAAIVCLRLIGQLFITGGELICLFNKKSLEGVK